MMKNLPLWIKAPLLMLINALPFVGMVFLYEWGGPMHLVLFPPAAIGLVLLNYYSCKRTFGFVLIQAFMCVCIFLAGNAFTYLYYHNISSDGMSIAMGGLLVYTEIFLILMATGCVALNKLIQYMKSKKSPQ